MEENEENIPILIASKPFKTEFANVQKIALSSGDFTIGRSLQNTVSIPFLSISRNHCRFMKIGDNDWYVEDNSSAGIKINNKMLGRGSKRKLKHEDLISLEPLDEFTYKFIIPSDNVFETPKKRMRMTECDTVMIDNVKLKFEESQKCEIQLIEDKIQNAKQMQTTSIILKEQLQEHMNRKVKKLEHEFSVQIENLQGEKNEVEKQKASLIVERDAQLANVKNEMNGKIAELMEQIKKHNETEFELLKDNGLLKEKLLKEREEFLLELNRESSSKQDMLEKLEAKVREQEEIRIKEKKDLEETLRRETEELRLSKEKELKELEELKRRREIELQQELNNIKKNLAEQVQQTVAQKLKAEQELELQKEIMKKLEAEDKAKTDEFQKVKEEIEKKLTEAQIDAEKSKVEVQARVVERETELAALAAERIQKQVDQSSEVISTLQEQLEKVKNQLKTVETEKNTLLENICTDPAGEGTSNQETLNNFGELMESELQCSVCAELFVEATTLNCSHTFCKYCIAMWKKKKRDCPICRSPITSECRSLVLDSFIEKMVQNLTDEMKKKRQEMLKSRAAEVQSSSRPATTNSSRRRRNTRRGATTILMGGRGGDGIVTTTRHLIPTVDLTTLPIPTSPAERPPVLPAPLAQLNLPVNLITSRRRPAVLWTENRTGMRGVRTHQHFPNPRMLQPTWMTPLRNRMEELAARLDQAVDLTRPLIARITAETRRTSTAGGQTRLVAENHLETHRQNRLTPIELLRRQMEPEFLMLDRQLTTLDGPMNLVRRIMANHTPLHHQSHQTRSWMENQAVDLTSHSLNPASQILETEFRQIGDLIRLRSQCLPILRDSQRLFPMDTGERPHIPQDRQAILALGEVRAAAQSPASTAPTMAATVAASRAAPADTGLPAAPSDNQNIIE